MSFLDELLQLVPLATPRSATTAAANVALHPAAPPATGVAGATGPASAAAPTARNAVPTPSVVRHGVLTHKTGGPPLGGTPPARVHAVLGPGATFRGLARMLLPVYAGLTGADKLNEDLLAKGLVVYDRDLLRAGTWEHHKVGMLLPLPIEIDGNSGAWTVNAVEVVGWAGAFSAGWRDRLDKPPSALDVLEPAKIEGEAGAIVAPPGTMARAPALWERAMRNPSEAVLTFVSAVGQLQRKGVGGPGLALTFALTAVQGALPHHVALLASTTAGNGILRRVRQALAFDPPPPGTNGAKLTDARKLVDDALFHGPAASRTLAPHAEVPETVEVLDPRQGPAKPKVGARTDPAGGLHRLVLGRDLAVGRMAATRSGTPARTWTGPRIDGRLDLEPFLKDDAAGLNPAGLADRAGRITLLDVFGIGGGRLDAVRANDDHLLTVGLGDWSAADDAGLAALLFQFKQGAPDEFDLFFGVHRLDVDQHPADATRFRLKSVADDGRTTTPLDTVDMRRSFLGGTTKVAGGDVTFGTEWPARFRFAALVSRRYRRQQVLLALPKLPHSAIEIAIASVDPFPSKPYELALSPSTALQTAMNARVPAFLRARPAGVASRLTMSGAVIDLAPVGLAQPTYASSQDVDDKDTGDDTLNIGSMAKMVAMYAAFELRFRLGKALDAAMLAHLPVASAGWESGFLPLVDKIWRPQIARGFPLLDTTKQRMPKWDQMFRFAAGGTFDFTHGTATDDQIVERDLDTPQPDMAFLELIKSMVFMSNAIAASRVIGAVGYPYINGLLREGGFWNPGTSRGIWMSGNYVTGGGWKTDAHGRDVDLVTLSARGARHYKATTNFVGNAKQLARLLALAAQKRLFDGPSPTATAACDQMVTIMRRHDIPPLRLPDKSFIQDALAAPPNKAFSKLGIGVAAPPSPLQGVHDGAILERTKGAHLLRYVVVALGGYRGVTLNFPHYQAFIRELDSALDSGHP